MTAAARPARRWSVALAAALIAHGLIAAWLWPRAAQPDAAAAAPTAILIELAAPNPPPRSSTTHPTTATAPARPAEPEPPRPPPPAPPRADAPRAIERPVRPAAATAPIPARSAPAASAPAEADAAAKSPQAESRSDAEPDSASRSTAAATLAAATAAATPRRGSTQGRTAAELAWQSRLLGHLEGFRRYPARALRQRQEGVTYLRFSVDRRGGIGAVRLERGSGSDLLDAEALDVVRRAQPVPAPPPEIEGDPVEVVVPVQFRLRRR